MWCQDQQKYTGFIDRGVQKSHRGLLTVLRKKFKLNTIATTGSAVRLLVSRKSVGL